MITRQTKRLTIGVIASIVVFAGTALAHHSAAAYDVEMTTTVTGIVKAFRWKNPHTLVTLTVTDEDGSAVDWNFEGNGASNLVRNGWKRSMLKVGETATIHANPMKSGEPGGRLQGITLPDGSVVGAKY